MKRLALQIAVAFLVSSVAAVGWADSRLFISDAGTLRISNAATLAALGDVSGTLSTTGGWDDGHHLVADCKGRRLFVSNHGPDFSVFDFSLGQFSPTFGPSLSEPLGMAALPDGKLLITDEENSKGLFRLNSDLSLDAQTPYSGLGATDAGAEGVAYDAVHDRIFVADEDDDEIEIFNGSSLGHIATVNAGPFWSDGIYWLAVDGSSNHVFALSDSKRDGLTGIHVFDITSGGDGLSFNQSLPGSSGTTTFCYKTLAVSEATDRLFAIDNCDHTVAIYDAATLASLGTVPASRAGPTPLMVSTAECEGATNPAPALSPTGLGILVLLLLVTGGVALLPRRRFNQV